MSEMKTFNGKEIVDKKAREDIAAIPKWAKQDTKPSYTADEVGAVSKEEYTEDISKLSSEIEELKKGESGESDTLIGTLPQEITDVGYYVFSPTDTTISTEQASEQTNILEQVEVEHSALTYENGTVSATGSGWKLAFDLSTYIEPNQIYTLKFGNPTSAAAGIRIYATDSAWSGYVSGTKIAEAQVLNGTTFVFIEEDNTTTNPATEGQFTWDGSTTYLYAVVGGSGDCSFDVSLYKGTLEDAEESEAITISLNANEKFSMDGYVGKTFYSESTVYLYKINPLSGNSSYVLPIATNDVLGGVKAIEKTDEMTQPVGIDAGGNLYVAPSKNDALYGKNVLFIGDSLTYGNMGTDPDTGGQLYPDKNYPQYFAEKTGCSVYNHGKSGANAVSYRDNVYSEIDFSVEYGIAIIMLGTNLGLTEDVYKKAYADIIEQLANDTGGKTQIFLVTPPYNNYASTGYPEYAKNANAIVKEMGQTYCLPVIDVYYESGLNQFNKDLCRPIDDLHFNDEGYRRLGNFIANKVLSDLWNLVNIRNRIRTR